jgi:sirohydrochlorin cobaltochelatase
MKSALILFAHGARDPRWAEPFRKLQDMIAAMRPELDVSLAFLDFMEPRLPDQVRELAQAGCDGITVVPVFFGQGGHVLRDLPPMVDALRADYPAIRLSVAPAVGEDPGVLNAIASYCMASVGSGGVKG